MIFDKSKVYTALNADELSVGDIVYLADNIATLRRGVEIGDISNVSILQNIYCEEEMFRFEDENQINYSFAYLICPERNAAAFKAWHEGKKIEMEYAEPDENESSVWRLFENEEPNWYKFHYRPAQEKTAEKEYRPFASLDELRAEFVKRFKTKTPSYALPLIWVKSIKDNNDRYLITGYIENEEDGQLLQIGDRYYGLSVFFEGFEFLDGSPCGVKD